MIIKMGEYTCKWCNTHFSTNGNLKHHQKTAKYCLELQGKEKSTFTCEECNNEFSLETSLKRHMKNACRGMILKENKRLVEAAKKDKETIQKLLSRITSLEGQLEGIKTAPPTTTINSKNTYYVNQKLANIPIENIRALTIETVKEDINSGKYTFEIFKRGIHGLVHFIDNIIKIENEDGTIERNYACTDSSRNKFYRLVHSRAWELDDGASFLTDILNQLQSQVKEYFLQCLDRKRDATDKNEKRRYQYIIDKTRILYQGVNSDEGPDREELFNMIRKKIKSIASV